MENKNIKVCVLISCMHQKDHSIVERSNIQTDAVVVNQCDEDSVDEYSFVNKQGRTCNVKFINTTERGLSKSRNMAINNAIGDICLICDDDEVLDDEYEDTIIKAFREYGEEAIAFRLDYEGKHFEEKTCVYNNFNCGRLSSVQMAFKRDAIVRNGVRFDSLMGAGSGNGAGEENKFVHDLIKNGVKVRYVPRHIGRVNVGESSWFNGYTDKYFQDMGWAGRRIYGKVYGFLFLAYFSVRHHNLGNKGSVYIFRQLLKGYKDKRG